MHQPPERHQKQPAPGSAPAARARLLDLLAALSVAGLLLPEAVAYAALAGLPAQAGLIALLAGLLSYAALGSSRFAVASATSSSAAVLAAVTSSIAGTGADAGLHGALAAGLVTLTGLFFAVGAAARLGGITAFIARPVLRGFAFGLALVIIVKQWAQAVGVHPHTASPLPFAFELLNRHSEWQEASLLLALGALALLVLLGAAHRLPGLGFMQRVPASLVVTVLGIGLGLNMDLHRLGISSIGHISLQLNTPALPGLSRAQWLRLAEVAFALALVLYAESYGAIRSLALRHGDVTAPNRDLLALGVANLVSGLMQGLPVGAGYSASAANETAGAQSRWAAALAGLVVLAGVLACLPWIEHMPEPVLAAVVVHAVGHTLRPDALRPYFRWHRDRLLVAGSIVAVLVLGVLDGLLASIAASLLMALRSLAQARVAELGRLGEGHTFVDVQAHPQAHVQPGLLILRPEAPLFFGNVERLLGEVRRQAAARPQAHAVILSLEETPNLDGSSIEGLRDLADEFAKNGIQLWLTRLKDPVHAVLQQARLPTLPSAHLCVLSVDDSVRAALGT